MNIRTASHAVVIGAAILAASPRAAQAYDLIFEYTSFGSTFGQAQFDVLNYAGVNGRYMNTSSDNHRGAMVAHGNELAQFYNTLTDRYTEQTVKNGAAAADAIHQYTMNNSYDTAFNPPRPQWIVLNEISPSLWSANAGPPSNSTYRTWLIDLVTRLSQHYGYNVVTLAPFQNPAQNNASWQALSAIPNSYIGIECYLSGTEVWNSGSDNAARLAWAQAQYQASKNSYLNRGVPEDRLFVTEHFANNDVTYVTPQGNVATTHWGRSGLASAADWDTVIQIRQDAIFNVGFEGFLAYNWGGNGMGVTQAEQIQHEYYYRSRRVLQSQRPQWLSDAAINVNGTTIPLSWNEPLNWLGGVPDAPGAEVNFWRTLSADRTITLDGLRTVGTLTFDSPHRYTIAPGQGGSLAFDNGTSAASLVSSQGDHRLEADVLLAGDLHAAVTAGSFTITRPVSGSGGLTKTGAGVLVLGAANSYGGATNIQEGVLRVGNTLTSPGEAISIGSGGRLEASSIVQRSIENNGVVAGPAAPAVLALAGSVSGAGSFTGNVRIDGHFSPGNGVGAVSFQHLRLNNQATLAIELGPPLPAAQYDRVVATGSLTLAGSLNVALVGGFTPAAGMSFNILDWGSLAGAFDSLDLPSLGPGLMWNASRLYVDGTLRIALAGDFDFNDVVDAADLFVWEAAYGASGSQTPTPGDADGDRNVDGADFLAWQRNVGMTFESAAAGTSVPEPASFGLLALAAPAFAIRRRCLSPYRKRIALN